MVERERSERKRGLGIDVLMAARQRIAWTFDTFPHIYLSGPSGKDSGVMMHLVCEEARRRGRKVGVLYVDLEAQYKLTIDHVREMFSLYADIIEPYWLAIPIRLRNAVSNHEPYWVAWEPEKRAAWVREPPPEAITDPRIFSFYAPPWRDKDGVAHAIEFEELIGEFGHWYGKGEATACFVGIRSDESLNRWRTIASDRKARFDGRQWTSWKMRSTYNVYPIYDWQTADVWTYFAREAKPYNRLYDMMHKAGLTIAQMRICQPYGDDQRRGLWLYHVIEPETWSRVVHRVSGANQGALYAGKSGNVLGNRVIELPPSQASWEAYVRFLLDSMPSHEGEHYRRKFLVFVRWWQQHGYPDGIPDEAEPKAEARREVPSWKRICKVILKNDRLCKGLSFTQTSSSPTAYEKYKAIMETRRRRWGSMGI
jgi:predicted phosphoadenosine phosphosulfate sulfurtransferase